MIRLVERLDEKTWNELQGYECNRKIKWEEESTKRACMCEKVWQELERTTQTILNFDAPYFAYEALDEQLFDANCAWGGTIKCDGTYGITIEYRGIILYFKLAGHELSPEIEPRKRKKQEVSKND